MAAPSSTTPRSGRLALPPDRWLAVAIILLAFLVRAGLIIATRHRYVPVNDPVDFIRVAKSIETGHGFGPTIIPGAKGPSAFRTPVYPAFLAIVFLIFGVKITIARLATALVSTAFVASVGALGWKLGGRRVGLLSMLGAALYPPFLLASYGLQYEVFLLLFSDLALLAILMWRDRPDRTWLLAVGGVFVGLAILSRETAAVLFIPMWIVIWQSRRGTSGPAVFRKIAVLTVVGVAVVAPWTIRNAVVMHAFIPVSDSPQAALAGSYNGTAAKALHDPVSWVAPWFDPTDIKDVDRLGPNPSEARVESTYESAALSYASSHPGYAARLIVRNTVGLFSLNGFRDATALAPLVPWNKHLIELSVIAFWIATPLAVLGLFTPAGRRVPRAFWAYLFILYCVLIVSVGDIQYRVNFEPLMVVLVAMTFVHYWERWFGPAPESVDDPFGRW